MSKLNGLKENTMHAGSNEDSDGGRSVASRPFLQGTVTKTRELMSERRDTSGV